MSLSNHLLKYKKNMNKKSIDEQAIKAYMNLESVHNHLDEIFIIFDTEKRIAIAKDDIELADFISEQMRTLSNVENGLRFGKDYLKNLVGLSWDLYGGDITTRTDGDD